MCPKAELKPAACERELSLIRTAQTHSCHQDVMLWVATSLGDVTNKAVVIERTQSKYLPNGNFEVPRTST